MKEEGQASPYVEVDPIILTSDGKIVLALRGKDSGAEEGKWHIPGDVVKGDESLTAALQRAARQKTNLAIELLYPTLRESFVNAYDAPKREPRYRDIGFAFLCRAVGGSMNPGPRMADVRAFEPKELYLLELGFDHKQIVLDAVARLSQLGRLP